MRHDQNKLQTEYSVNATAIITFWEIGTASLAFYKRQHRNIAYSDKKNAMVAECQRLQKHYRDRLPIRPNPTTILKYWKVAEVFSESKIHKLAQKISNRGSRFAPSHLMRCLAVTDPDSLRNLLKDAVKASWGRRKLKQQSALPGRDAVKSPVAAPRSAMTLTASSSKRNRFATRGYGGLKRPCPGLKNGIAL
ncbi:hypothetical protein BH11PLA2_BH11PLA2_39780 [soil metagenome]